MLMFQFIDYKLQLHILVVCFKMAVKITCLKCFLSLGTKEFTMIPVGIKIFKLIVNELASEIEKNELAEDNEDEDDDEVPV